MLFTQLPIIYEQNFLLPLLNMTLIVFFFKISLVYILHYMHYYLDGIWYSLHKSGSLKLQVALTLHDSYLLWKVMYSDWNLCKVNISNKILFTKIFFLSKVWTLLIKRLYFWKSCSVGPLYIVNAYFLWFMTQFYIALS